MKSWDVQQRCDLFIVPGREVAVGLVAAVRAAVGSLQRVGIHNSLHSTLVSVDSAVGVPYS